MTPTAAGKSAAAQLTDVGHTLTYVQRQPGFVCRVDGAPASDPCVNTPPADAVLVAVVVRREVRDVDLLVVRASARSRSPTAGYVALSWQGGDGKAPPA